MSLLQSIRLNTGSLYRSRFSLCSTELGTSGWNGTDPHTCSNLAQHTLVSQQPSTTAPPLLFLSIFRRRLQVLPVSFISLCLIPSLTRFSLTDGSRIRDARGAYGSTSRHPRLDTLLEQDETDCDGSSSRGDIPAWTRVPICRDERGRS